MTDAIAHTQPQLTARRPYLDRALGPILKRVFDVLMAAAGLFVLWPLFVLVAAAIKRDSPGPVFYRGRRMGKSGHEFRILKFRTMYEHPASYNGARITGNGDGRITRVGRWLRGTKLNELPQLWNVLVGDMSLVGPRPEDPEIAKTWPSAVFEEVLSMRPGITSPASVIYRDEEKLLNSASVMDEYLRDLMPDKCRLDRLYVRNHSFLSDLDLLFSTATVLLPGVRRVPLPTESLFHGLLYNFAHRYFSWFVADTITAFMAVTLVGVIRRLEAPLDIGIGKSIVVAAALALTFSLVNSMLGLGRVSWRHAASSFGLSLAFSALVSTFLLWMINWRSPLRGFVPMGMIPEAGLLAWIGFMATRYRERLITGLATQWLLLRRDGSGVIGERVLIVGAGECSLLALWLLQRSRLGSAFSVIGMVDDDPGKHGMTIDGHRVHGLTSRIPDLVRQHDIRVIMFAIEDIDADERLRILSLCKQTPARIVHIPDLMGMFRDQMNQPNGVAA